MSAPDFIVIGAMKCGTSTVCAYLEDHPDIYMVPKAEPRFFSEDENYAKGTAWYEETYFSGRAGEKLAGEGSNNYAFRARFPQTVSRMSAYQPDLKIVYIVRHPIKRIVSSWIQRRSDMRDAVPATLDQAVAQMPDLFVDQSLYWQTISDYRAAFGPERIFVGFMEDMQSDPDRFFAELCAFLEVPPAQIRRGHENKSAGKALPSPLYSRVNALPGVALLKRLAPTKLRRAMRRKLSRPVADRPQFSPQGFAQLRAVIAPDTQAFLNAYGKTDDFWDLDSY